ncbi:MAG TPA: hypothetical protein VGO96_19320 [Pyrinomonadaceae bacterium]|jgi:hypothetical protein|nr:hypothetical protein [Pyrinomonadaceae bacterium]
MSEAEGRTKKQSEQSRAAMLSFLHDFDPDHLVLPHDEIRLLALIISTRDGAEPFIRRMVNISESLRAGRIDAVARLARQSRDHTLTELLAPMSQAVSDGRIVAARNTTFLAASFAYQNSLDYLRELMKYLSQFKPGRAPLHLYAECRKRATRLR